MKKMKIGILSSGGDCPGINATIRGVGKTAIMHYGMEVIGIHSGFAGLLNKDVQAFDERSLSGILNLGGTILGTSPIPMSIIIKGNQAIGGIGLINSNRVPSVASNVLFHPIRIPKGIPIPQENTSAMSTLLRLAHIWPHIYCPLIGTLNVFRNLSSTSTGEGTRTLLK